MQMGEASKVAPVDKLSVVIAMLLAMLILGEHPGRQHWLGAALIIGSGLYIYHRERQHRPKELLRRTK